jgi:hypothetical protein
LREEQAFGNDDQKNTPVEHLLWENFPLPVWEDKDGNILVQDGVRPPWWDHNRGIVIQDFSSVELNYKIKTGCMTGRDVLQHVGTNIFRQFHPSVWVDSCIRTIKKHPAYYNNKPCLVTDTRFPNEVEGVQMAGGKVIRLTRVVNPNDTHPSETALDRENFDWRKFDAVIDNHKMGIPQELEMTYQLLREWKVLKDIHHNVRYKAAFEIEKTHKFVAANSS